MEIQNLSISFFQDIQDKLGTETTIRPIRKIQNNKDRKAMTEINIATEDQIMSSKINQLFLKSANDIFTNIQSKQ